MTSFRYVFLVQALLAAFPIFSQDAPYSYHRLEGTIGGQPVVMHLHRHGAGPFGQGATPTYDGVYYYAKYEFPIQFYGEATAKGDIQLSEGLGGQPTGIIRLAPLAGGATGGEWVDTSGVRKLRVSLREAYPEGTLRLSGGFLMDTLPLFPDHPASPQASASFTWVEPAATTEKSLRDYLWKELAEKSLNDSALARRCCETPREVFGHLRDQAFAGYRDSLAHEVHPDSADYFFMYNYSHDISMAVTYNDKGLLSLGITDYVYAGGAHGNYATAFYTYDLRKRRLMRLSDVLRPGFERDVEAALARAARRRAGLKPGEPLDSYYFVENIPATENFYLTGKGIVFGYPPYEIASYADGQVELFVPFAEVKKWVR
jgi:hypothetical protein